MGSHRPAPSPSRMESESLQCLLPAPSAHTLATTELLVSPGTVQGQKNQGIVFWDRGAPLPPTRPALLSHHSVSGCQQPQSCLSSCLRVGTSEELAPQSGWALTTPEHQPEATGTQPSGRGWRVGGGIGKSDMVCFRSKRPWDWRGSPRRGPGGGPSTCGPTQEVTWPRPRSQRCGTPLLWPKDISR